MVVGLKQEGVLVVAPMLAVVGLGRRVRESLSGGLAMEVAGVFVGCRRGVMAWTTRASFGGLLFPRDYEGSSLDM